ncbi:uncharacterized protein METZ01_LOCUS160144 [marine metagenome]|uniref:Uncharacterized protein n=1 Tax=marine metagenome TaxID=408172 RepID=A0A382B0F9_9ZZZZ
MAESSPRRKLAVILATDVCFIARLGFLPKVRPP